MPEHRQINHFDLVTSKPVAPPGETEHRQKMLIKNSGLMVFIWNANTTAWEPGQLRPMIYAGDPTNNVTPDFAQQLLIDTTNNRLYYATGTAAANWAKISV
jgi:hypothetical protein